MFSVNVTSLKNQKVGFDATDRIEQNSSMSSTCRRGNGECAYYAPSPGGSQSQFFRQTPKLPENLPKTSVTHYPTIRTATVECSFVAKNLSPAGFPDQSQDYRQFPKARKDRFVRKHPHAGWFLSTVGLLRNFPFVVGFT